MRGSAALNGVIHPPEDGPQAAFRLVVESRATRLEITPLPVTSRIGRTIRRHYNSAKCQIAMGQCR